MSGIDEIFAQFKVIKMEELRSMTPNNNDRTAVHGGKGKIPRNSNVTLIHVMPSEQRAKRRRSDKEIRPRAEASDLEIVTVLPVTQEEARNNTFLKLHILNVRTGKIQDAIISTKDDYDESSKQSRQKASASAVAAAGEKIKV
jgi:hypothetical protein